MKFLRNFKSRIIIIILIILIFSITIYSYIKPNSKVNEVITYYNSVSSLIIMILTIGYVYTTIGQLSSMKNQLNLMDKSVNLQVQPLPVPKIEEIYLEKINAYKSPEDGFSSIHVIYRFHCKSNFINAGNGAALNVAIYSSLVFDELEEAVTTQSSSQIYCISDKNMEKDTIIYTMILDRKYEILNALLEGSLNLRMDIYYKNIFGAGFNECAVYSLYLKDEEAELAKGWLEYIKDFVKNNSVDFKRHKALASSVPSDAEMIFSRIRSDLENNFKSNLHINYRIEPESFEVKLVNYDESIKIMDKKYKEAFDKFKNCESQTNNPIIEVAISEK